MATRSGRFTVGALGRVELSNGSLRLDEVINNGVIIGSGHLHAGRMVINGVTGRIDAGRGDRLILSGDSSVDNRGEIAAAGGEIEFFGGVNNSNAAAEVTLRDGGVVRFGGGGLGNGSGLLASTAGTNDVHGAVSQTAGGRIVVAGGSTAVFHDPVTNAGGTIQVFPGSTPVFLRGLTVTGPTAVLSVPLDAPGGTPGGTPRGGKVEVAGAAQVAGNLQLTLAAGLSPQPGDQFTVLTAGGVSGAFAAATATNAPAGIQFHPVQTATEVRVLTAGAGDRTWGVDADGATSLGANWLGGVAPNGVGERAAFTTIATADRTVTVDSPFTAGSLHFDDDNGYRIQGAGITLDVSAGSARIDVKNLHGSGAHVISAPLTLNDDTAIDVAAGGTLGVTSQITANGVSLAKAGAGTLAVPNVRARGLRIDAGTVRVAPNGGNEGTSVVGSLAVAGSPGAYAGKLDLANNAMVIDYTPGPGQAGSPIPEVRALVASGFAGGAWGGNGVTSETAAADLSRGIGYAEAADVLGPSGGNFAGQAVDGTSVLVRTTLDGDANLDGRVNGSDFALLAGNFGRSGRTWFFGDFNYDEVVNGSDFALLAGNFGRTLPAALESDPSAAAVTAQDWAALEAFGGQVGVSVPEPAAAGAAGLAAGWGFLRRRRRR
jgi:hypothetical protein